MQTDVTIRNPIFSVISKTNAAHFNNCDTSSHQSKETLTRMLVIQFHIAQVS